MNVFANLTGTFANTAAVLIGALVGVLFNRLIPDKYTDTVIKGLGLCTITIGISGVFAGGNTLIMVLSIVSGAVTGELLKIEDRLNSLGQIIQNKIERKRKKGQSDDCNEKQAPSFSSGLVAASLVFCVGSMAVIGSIEAAVGEGFSRHSTLLVKSLLDLVTAIAFASQLGAGVAAASASVLLYQGFLTVCAMFAGNFMSDQVIGEMTCVGSVLLIGVGANMLGITKLKNANYLPAILIAAVLTWAFEYFGVYSI